MKKALLFGVFLALASGFIAKDSYRLVKNTHFGKGEHIEYSLGYAFMNAGEANIDISDKLYSVNDRPCYRIDVYGKSIGTLEAITRIRDFWRSYVDTSAIITHRFYRNIQEGNYRKEETTLFKPTELIAQINDENGTRNVKTPANVQDMVSGFFFIRTLNFENYRENDIIKVPGILEADVYNLEIMFLGKQEVKTKFGKIDTYVLSPIMPENQLFRGKHPVKVFVSDDANRIPVKIQADMLVGAVEVDLKAYKNLKHKMKFK